MRASKLSACQQVSDVFSLPQSRVTPAAQSCHAFAHWMLGSGNTLHTMGLRQPAPYSHHLQDDTSSRPFEITSSSGSYTMASAYATPIPYSAQLLSAPYRHGPAFSTPKRHSKPASLRPCHTHFTTATPYTRCVALPRDFAPAYAMLAAARAKASSAASRRLELGWLGATIFSWLRWHGNARQHGRDPCRTSSATPWPGTQNSGLRDSISRDERVLLPDSKDRNTTGVMLSPKPLAHV